MVYDLTDEEMAVLTSNSLEEHSVEQRLAVQNGVIGADFADKVTIADLDSERRIALVLHPEVQRELAERQRQEQEILSPLEMPLPEEEVRNNAQPLRIGSHSDLVFLTAGSLISLITGYKSG